MVQRIQFHANVDASLQFERTRIKPRAAQQDFIHPEATDAEGPEGK